MDVKKLLAALSDSVGIGSINSASLIAKRELSKYSEVSDFGTIGVIGKIDKGADCTLLLDAHIDEVGFIVTNVFDDGFVKVSNVGGIDPRILPASRVIIHGKEKVSAVFTSTPPHLAKNESDVVTIDDIMLDTGLGKSVRDIVSVGDFATFDSSFATLHGSRVTGKSFDDRSAVVALIELASRIYDKDIPYNIVISLSEQEELGTRGAVTSAFANECDEAIAVDVSFGTQPTVSAEESGKLGGGVMIGISPILSKEMTDRLTLLAKENGISHQFEVMGGKTGTDADVISVSKSGIPSALLSIPLRNMHTPVEIIDINDLSCVADLLEKYILGGGANA